MTRLGRFMQGLGSAVGLIAANGLFTLLSVPLALHFLEREEFGLWVLMLQIVGYFHLIDLGMNSAVTRLLIDHKDRPNDGSYGALIVSSCMVCGLQGLFVLGMGLLLAEDLALALNVNVELMGDFTGLMAWNCALAAGSMWLRPMHNILYAHQRLDIINHAQSAGLVLNYAVMWAAFSMGAGVFSLMWGMTVSWLLTQAMIVWSASGLLPARSGWRKPEWKLFTGVFHFAKDLFLVQAGIQMMDASQLIVITRTMGLEAAALWSVGTKAFQMVAQIHQRLLGVATPALCEMIARSEMERLRKRFTDMVCLVVGASVVAGTGIAVCNGAFVSLWTHGRMIWEPAWSVLLGVLLVTGSVRDFHAGFVPMTKQIGALKIAYVVEGGLFIGLGFLVAPRLGFTGLLVLFLTCRLLLTTVYSLWRTALFLEMPLKDLCVCWLAVLGRMGLRMGAVGVLVHAMTLNAGDWTRLLSGGVVITMTGIYWLARLGVGEALRNEFMTRLPAGMAKLLKFTGPGLGR